MRDRDREPAEDDARCPVETPSRRCDRMDRRRGIAFPSYRRTPGSGGRHIVFARLSLWRIARCRIPYSPTDRVTPFEPGRVVFELELRPGMTRAPTDDHACSRPPFHEYRVPDRYEERR